MTLPAAICYLGLISGTSADGIDAALVRFAATTARTPELLFGRTYAWDAGTARAPGRARPAVRATAISIAIAELDVRIGRAFADAALQALADSGIAAADVAAIGSHGQTLRHRRRPATGVPVHAAARRPEHDRRAHRHPHGRGFPPPRCRRRRPRRAAAAGAACCAAACRRRGPRGAQPRRHRQPHAAAVQRRRARLRHRPGQRR